MKSLLIDTVIQIGDFIHDIECEAEVDYTVDGGELTDWGIREFWFTVGESRQMPDGTWKFIRTGKYPCPDVLRPALLAYVDKDAVESDLVERLYLAGEMYCTDAAELRRDYHAGVL